MEIYHGELLALSALELACSNLVAALKVNLTLGISLSGRLLEVSACLVLASD